MSEAAEFGVKARLLVTSEVLSPQFISAALGIQPSRSWLKGEAVHPKATKTFTENAWVLIESQSGATAAAEPLVDKLLSAVDRQKLSALVSQHADASVELSLIVYVADSAPPVSLSPLQVKYLAEVGADIDVDIYPMGNSGQEVLALQSNR